MKKISLLIFSMFLIFVFSSCKNNNYSSSDKYNMTNEYYTKYNIKKSIYTSLTYEQLYTLLNYDGNHLILLTDNHEKLKEINDLAIKYKISNIYHFSFTLNGITEGNTLLIDDLANQYFNNNDITNNLLLYNKKIITQSKLNNNIGNFFQNIKSYELTNYTNDDFIKTIYKDIFHNEKINIKTLTYDQLIYLLNQKGNFIILFGGAWCPNSRAVIKILNEYAINNNIFIYVFDTKLDGGVDNTINLSITSSLAYSTIYNKLYVDLINNYLYNIETLYQTKFVSYPDESNNIVSAKLIQVPYLLLYNKNNSSPIISHIEQMYSLNEDKDNYIYNETNYKLYTDSLSEFITTYINQK